MSSSFRYVGVSEDGKIWKIVADNVSAPTTPPPEPPQPEQIIVTPQNYKQILTNIEGVDFSGSNADYIQVNRDHNMLAIPCNWEDLRVEMDCQIMSSDQTRLIQLQARGGRHSDSAMCEGCAYKASFGRQQASHRKEIFHRSSNLPGGNGYCSDRAENVKGYTNIVGRRSKLAFDVMNLTDGRVSMLAAVDGNTVCNYIDSGTWQWQGTNIPSCPARQLGNTGNRKSNEILNKAGTWVIVRSDGATVFRIFRIVVTKK